MDVLKEGKQRGKNIADVVKEQVHGTTVGKGSTVEWIDMLLAELRHHLAVPVDSSEWSEDTIGTLMSAAGMTVRYVTEAPTFAAYVAEFESIFLQVLGIPNWTKPFLGLKMVSLRGCTRLLESFAEVVQRHADVLAWISSALDVMMSTDDENAMVCIQLLLRPTCEHLNVLVQAHPASIPLLLPIVPRYLHLYTAKLSAHPTKQFKDDILELASFISVLLDAVLSPLPSARSLLATPLQLVHPSPLLPLHVMDGDAWRRFHSSSAAMNSMLSVLPSLYAAATYDLPRDASADCFDAFFQHIITTLGEAVTTTPGTIESLEHVLTAVEALRDLLLRRLQLNPAAPLADVAPFVAAVPAIQDVFTYVGDMAKDRSVRGIKATVADVRDLGIETYIALMHVMGAAFWAVETEHSFLHAVAVKAADPLIFGDFLNVLRPFDVNNAEECDRYAAKVADVVAVLTKGLRQAHRYSKTLAVRMVDGVAQIAIGAGSFLLPHVLMLAETLLDVQAVSSGVRNASIVALTRLYCVAPFDEAIAPAYFELVTDGVLAMRDPALESLCTLLGDHQAASVALDSFPATFWLEFLASCTDMFAAVPIFEEDIPVLMHQLQICRARLTLRLDDVPSQVLSVVRPAVQTLHATAQSDGIVDIVDEAESLLVLLPQA